MCTMTVFMRMHFLPIATVCGGIGDSIIPGDGVHPGIIAVGTALAIGMVAIGVVGLIIIITIIGTRDTIITRIMLGVE